MAQAHNEQALVIQFRDARQKLNQLKEAATEAQKEFDDIERRLIERLTEQGKDATARFDKIGYVAIHKPAVYASYAPENKKALFAFLCSRKRQDLIQKVINARSLSIYVKELLDNNKKVPDCISYYMKQSARFYADKKGA